MIKMGCLVSLITETSDGPQYPSLKVIYFEKCYPRGHDGEIYRCFNETLHLEFMQQSTY
jgi:hypothetical protein